MGVDGRLDYGWALFVTLAAIRDRRRTVIAQLIAIEGTPVQ